MGINPATPEKERIKTIKEKKEKPPAKEPTKREFMDKIEELQKNVTAEHQRAETYLRELKYAKADIENVRKTLEKQIEYVRKTGNERIIIQLFVILDEFHIAFESWDKNSKEDLLKGLEIILMKFEKILEAEGLKLIEALEKPFDPSLHQAIMKVEIEEVPEGTVVEEVKPGYTLGGKVIRPSIVKVSVKPKIKENTKE